LANRTGFVAYCRSHYQVIAYVSVGVLPAAVTG
jgi:hypothetical protein